ncbi:3D domain-containing protein [Clostridium paraputrificum]|uniref:3D domain-containing protein n=1 Tax=Clostridium TaxID=1485 RepID=UPI003D351866
MKKKLTAVILSISLFLNISIPAFATNSLDQSKGEFNQISSEIKELDNQISALDDEIYTLKEKVQANEKEVIKVESEIETTKIKIKTLEEEIEENEKILSSRLREIYKNGSLSSINMLLYVFESDSLSDLFTRINTTKTIIAFDNKLIDETNEMVNSLNTSVTSLEAKKEALDLLNKETKESLLLVQEKQNTIATKKVELSKERDKISNSIRENEEKLVNHQISIVYSSNPTVNQLNEAIMTLKSLLPQISTDSVKNKVNEAISEAQELIERLGKPTTPPPVTDGNYKATYIMEATAYSGHGITAMGTVPVRDPDGLSTVAVDKSVIPLGSKVFIPNYGYAIAADTGGAIIGMKIDLYMNSKEECYQFGRRNVTVHVIAYPGEW